MKELSKETAIELADTEDVDEDDAGEEVWTIPEQRGKCGYHVHKGDVESKVLVTANVVRDVLGLTFLHQETEFMVYLLGEDGGDEYAAIANDIYVPNQIVSVARVEMPGDENIPHNVVGVLHKHPGGGKQNFSSTDDHMLNINHDVSLVIPEHGGPLYWSGEVRYRPECGCEERVEAEIVFQLITKKVMKASEERVERGSTAIAGHGLHGPGYHGWQDGVM